jgi:hypothetical protein
MKEYVPNAMICPTKVGTIVITDDQKVIKSFRRTITSFSIEGIVSTRIFVFILDWLKKNYTRQKYTIVTEHYGHTQKVFEENRLYNEVLDAVISFSGEKKEKIQYDVANALHILNLD